MLVSGGMEHQFGQMLTEHAAHRDLIIDVCDHAMQLDAGCVERRELLFDLKHSELRVIDENQFFRLEPDDLAAQFGADASRRSRHENRATRDVTCDPFHIELRRFAT